MNNALIGFAMNMISRNPNIQKNPQAQEMIDVIRRGDNVRGQEIALNLCNTYGVRKEDAINNAAKYFHLS